MTDDGQPFDDGARLDFVTIHSITDDEGRIWAVYTCPDRPDGHGGQVTDLLCVAASADFGEALSAARGYAAAFGAQLVLTPRQIILAQEADEAARQESAREIMLADLRRSMALSSRLH